jgi:hypothetical protein
MTLSLFWSTIFLRSSIYLHPVVSLVHNFTLSLHNLGTPLDRPSRKHNVLRIQSSGMQIVAVLARELDKQLQYRFYQMLHAFIHSLWTDLTHPILLLLRTIIPTNTRMLPGSSLRRLASTAPPAGRAQHGRHTVAVRLWYPIEHGPWGCMAGYPSDWLKDGIESFLFQ